MAKQPSVIFIARHGARLDQASLTWRDSAAKPYDPPLTYAGWIQCQMLGSRIESELRSYEKPNAVREEQEPPRKKRRIIIHSSPYLRCLQTSIAVGAGMRQVQAHPRHSRPPTTVSASAPLERIESRDESETGIEKGKSVHPAFLPDDGYAKSGKPELRVDAYLGEWLSPSYFEASTAPPSTEELLLGAKIPFESPAEEIKGADLSIRPIPEFAGVDWPLQETEVSTAPVHEKTGLRAMAATGHTLSKRSRRSFVSENPIEIGSKPSVWHTTPYSPPIPTYSIAARDPIPIGFVAHARDACVQFDAEWNSTKEPLEWGDGGAFGEEWSAMHRRFRNGLQKMLAFYETSEEDSTDEEIVLILITHQAGCNALIRLLTGAPALHDVGTASLTMAVRREGLVQRRESESESRSLPARRGSLDLGIADDFEVKIIASTEHLRGGSNPLGLNSPRLSISPALASRRAAGADSAEGFSIGDPMARSQSGHGLLGRSLSQRSFAADEQAAAQSGLWRSDSNNSESVEDKSTSTASLWGSDSEGRLAPALPVRSASQRDLWGGASSIRRDRSPGKRRWTAVDRSP